MAQTSPQRTLCVMRHGARLDSTVTYDAVSDAAWPDRRTRPYDSPLAPGAEGELCVQAERLASALRSAGRPPPAVVLSSPFRRCLQTAGLVAQRFGLSSVTVDNRLGEYLPSLRRCWSYLPPSVPERTELEAAGPTYTSLEDAERWAGVALRWDRDAHVVLHEPDSLQHRAETVETVVEGSAAADGDVVIVVTHGDLCNAFLPRFDWDHGLGRYAVDVAGWALLDGWKRMPVMAGSSVELTAASPRVLACERILML